MLFNSIEFTVFLPVVFLLYWFVTQRNLRLQNALLIAASYFFYGWWDWRFLSLLAVSTVVDFLVGQQIGKATDDRHRKRWLAVSMTMNLGMLGVFKYFNFFIESWVDAWAGIGVTMPVTTIQIVLPVGISFYTFQTLSYVLQIYRGKMEPTKDFIAFGAFIAFFPQLAAGPIERASALLPQFTQPREFQYVQAMQGVRLIIWGFFKKVAVADNCGKFVGDVFDAPDGYSYITLLLGGVFFAFQIYGDFSGYSDIAIGTAKLFGIELMSNFKVPYFSRTISEFWKRWHISLSNWFQDYLFMPLAIKFRNLRKWGIALAVFVTFLVSGLWHGANWTFVVWGAFHGFLLVCEQGIRTLFPGRLPDFDSKYKITQLPLIGLTFGMVCLGLVFFRADSLGEAGHFLNRILHLAPGNLYFPATRVVAYLGILLMFDWIYRSDERDPMARGRMPKFVHQGLVMVVMLTVMRWMFSNESTFIYFQF